MTMLVYQLFDMPKSCFLSHHAIFALFFISSREIGKNPFKYSEILFIFVSFIVILIIIAKTLLPTKMSRQITEQISAKLPKS